MRTASVIAWGGNSARRSTRGLNRARGWAEIIETVVPSSNEDGPRFAREHGCFGTGSDTSFPATPSRPSPGRHQEHCDIKHQVGGVKGSSVVTHPAPLAFIGRMDHQPRTRHEPSFTPRTEPRTASATSAVRLATLRDRFCGTWCC